MSDSKNNNVDYLATLPYDIITEMLSHMSIANVEHLKKETSYRRWQTKDATNKYQGVDDASEDRKSVRKYLSAHFGDGTKLLEAMSKYYVYISGSRSLEFFDKGHVSDDSDWDMYVSTWPGHITGMMRVLEELGVTWMSPREELAELKEKGTGSIVVSPSKLKHLMRDGCFASATDDMQSIINAVDHADMVNYTLTCTNTTFDIRFNEAGNGYNADNTLCIIRGKLKHKGTTTPVQLIVESRGDVTASIVAPFTYHSSCVQSFIGPYNACHMYGELTSKGKSYGWRDNISTEARRRLPEYHPHDATPSSLVPVWSKYITRGFEYINPPELQLGFDLRTAEDGESTWLEYTEHTNAPPDVIKLYTQVARSVSWFQVTDGTIPIHFPVKATYKYNELDFQSWFDRSDAVTEEVTSYFIRYMPYLHYRHDNTAMMNVY
jgi:hypothetical protein